MRYAVVGGDRRSVLLAEQLQREGHRVHSFALEKAELPAAEDLSAPALGRIDAALRQRIEQGGAVSIAALGQELSGEEMSLLVRILDKPELLSRGEQALRDYINKIQEHKNERQQGIDLKKLQEELQKKKGYRG